MKRCIIVGAGSGVSAAVALRFGTGGYTVGLISRNAQNLEDLSKRLSDAGVTAFWETANAGDAEELDQALDSLVSRQGSCDVLVYNAAVLRPGKPLDVTTDDIAVELAVNLLGAHRAVKKLAPKMIERGAGTILFTGGGLSLEPFPEWTSLALGKSALRSLAISLYKDLAPKGVHVSVLAICGIVAPGGPFDPSKIAEEYWRVATRPVGVADREVVFQPAGTDPFYNDPEKAYSDVSVLPSHMRQASS
ncbi:SDR family oxidoreductase [Denitrobaculum tricleocarpae]|uniref:SDR family oxidoreductase n=1 Tax=Denitrobaculum tricleocarpae TaxID=2591009 RepID=UPI0015D16AAA|nr:SDR family oxidoreductase [Denitrobaculum tricleocarpae]